MTAPSRRHAGVILAADPHVAVAWITPGGAVINVADRLVRAAEADAGLQRSSPTDDTIAAADAAISTTDNSGEGWCLPRPRTRRPIAPLAGQS